MCSYEGTVCKVVGRVCVGVRFQVQIFVLEADSYLNSIEML